MHVCIIGFAKHDIPKKLIWDYHTEELEDGQKIEKGVVAEVGNISPYLFDGPDAVLPNRPRPFGDAPIIIYGNKPTDDGNFLMTTEEKAHLLAKEPNASKWIRPYVGAVEFINGIERWCLWLKDITPNELRQLPLVTARVEAVRKFRLDSIAETTRAYARFPTLCNRSPHPIELALSF